MSLPMRPAMRMLSRRLRDRQYAACLTSPAACQIRCASSRYSSPTKRSFTVAPAPPLSFTAIAPEAIVASSPEAPPAVDHQQAWEQKRQYHIRRMKFAGLGLLLSLSATAVLVYSIDLDDLEKTGQAKSQRQGSGGHKLDASNDDNASFQGKEVHVIGAGDGKKIVAQSAAGPDIELVETGTSSVPHYPRTIWLPVTTGAVATEPNSSATGTIAGTEKEEEEYTLVGLGIRTVMWIQVYVVGLYIRTQDISTLQEKLVHSVNPIASTLVPAEKETLQKKLLDPKTSWEMWNELLQVPGLKTAWRVSPTRNTDFGHLRDGFVTGINKRVQEMQKIEQKPAGESEFDSEAFGLAVQHFKRIFISGKAPKGSLLIMRRDTSGAMDMMYQAKPGAKGAEKKIEMLGSVADERISRLIWLGYLGGDKVSSEAARQGVVTGCINFASRPVGSVETMVT